MKENSLVKDQYMRWPYPKPVYDLDEYFKTNKQLGCPSSDRGFYNPFPRREKFNPRILVAGCGAYQAAAIAYKNPESEVVGVDISTTSLGLTDDLKRKHRLSNLTLHETSLLDIAELNQTFDLIISTGVIHHLPSPTLALNAFKSVLKPDGSAYIMVYGQTYRTGIYWIQEVFRTMKIMPQSEAEVWKALDFITKLPKRHPIHHYIHTAKRDLSFPGGVIDTFFHPQDTSYLLSEIYAMVDQAGLAFRGFQMNGHYFHEHILETDVSNIYIDEICQLPFYQQASVVELLAFNRGTHRFYVGHKPVFNFDAIIPPDDFEIIIPTMVGLVVEKTEKGFGFAYKLGQYPAFLPAKAMIAVANLINAKRTFGDIIDELVKASKDINREQARDIVFKVSRNLWMRGALLFIG